MKFVHGSHHLQWRVTGVLAVLFASCFIPALRGAASDSAAAAPAQVASAGPAATTGQTLEERELAIDKAHMRRIYNALQAYRHKYGQLPDWLSDLYPEFLTDTNLLMSPVELRTGRSQLWGNTDPKMKTSYVYEFNGSKAGGLRDQSIALTMREWKRLQMEEFGPVIPILRCHLHDPILNLSYSGVFYRTGLFWETDTNTFALMAKLGPGPGEQNGRRMRVFVHYAANHAPAEGVTVKATQRYSEFGFLPPRVSHTDAHGECVVNLGGKQPTSVTLAVSLPGYVTQRSAWTNVVIPATWEVNLPKAVSVGGLVLDPAGQPIRGATVSVHTVVHDAVGQAIEVPIDSVTTDASGHWICRSAPPDFKALSFNLSQPEFRPIEYYLSANGQPGPEEVTKADLLAAKAKMVMKPAIPVTGTVTDANRKPIRGASVFLRENSDPPKDHQTTTDAAGHFRFSLFQAGDGTVAAAAPGFSPGAAAVTFADKAPPPVKLKMSPAQPLRGRVVDDQGNPVAGATVTLLMWHNLPFPKWTTLTDTKGQFHWDSAPAEGATYSVSKEGYISRSQVVGMRRSGSGLLQMLSSGLAERTFMLRRIGTITGHVVDAVTKAPIPEFQVYWGQSLGNDQVYWQRYAPVQGSNGHYVFRNQQGIGGQIRLLVEAKGYLPQVSPQIPTSGSHISNFALKKGEGPKGIVKLPNGQPAAKATVALVAGYTMLKGDQLSQSGSSGTCITTGADGKFALPAAFGTEVVAVNPTGYAEAELTNLDCTLTLTLRPWGRIEGTMRNGPQPATNQWVMVAPRIGGAPNQLQYDFNTYRVQTDDHGRFTIDQVPPGKRYLTRIYPMGQNRGWQWSNGQIIEVQPGNTTHIQFGGHGRMVIGKVVPSDPKRQILWNSGFSTLYRLTHYAGMQPVHTAEPPRNYTVQFNPDGSFHIDDVAPGQYRLNLQFFSGQGFPATGASLGSIHQEVDVPPQPKSSPATPVDLGQLELMVQPR